MANINLCEYVLYAFVLHFHSHRFSVIVAAQQLVVPIQRSD